MEDKGKKITSVAELLSSLKSDTQKKNGPFWYRGMSRKEWPLMPTIYRGQDLLESNLLKIFKQNATLLVNPRPVSPIEWLFVMRHHHAPTRLLDWTESPLIALYFVVEQDEDQDGALWVLMPLKLNKQESKIRPDDTSLPSFDEDKQIGFYAPDQFDTIPLNDALPIAFIAPRNTSRMLSQLSVFTIHHRKRIAIEKIGDGKHIWKYIIPSDSKKYLKKELKVLGISRFQLFPELESIGDLLGSY